MDLDFEAQSGTQWFVPSNDKSLFGAFRDATPDSWGQRVIEARLGTRLQQPDWVYLEQAGNDRVGALGFSATLGWTEPPRTHYSLSKLFKAAQALDDGQMVNDAERRMLDPESSMGGARPKANVVDPTRIRETACLHLAIGAQDKRARLENCLTAAGDFGLSATDAHAAIEQVVQSWSQWPAIAEALDMSTQDKQAMAECFQWGAHNVQWWRQYKAMDFPRA